MSSIDQMKRNILLKLAETPGSNFMVDDLPGQGLPGFAACLLELDGDGLIIGSDSATFGSDAPFGLAKITGKGSKSLRS